MEHSDDLILSHSSLTNQFLRTYSYICDLNEIGDEQHLMSCSNTMFRTLRKKFIDNLYKINKSLMLFNKQDLFHYVSAMKDKNILKISSKYCFDVLAAFDLLE